MSGRDNMNWREMFFSEEIEEVVVTDKGIQASTVRDRLNLLIDYRETHQMMELARKLKLLEHVDGQLDPEWLSRLLSAYKESEEMGQPICEYGLIQNLVYALYEASENQLTTFMSKTPFDEIPSVDFYDPKEEIISGAVLANLSLGDVQRFVDVLLSMAGQKEPEGKQLKLR